MFKPLLSRLVTALLVVLPLSCSNFQSAETAWFETGDAAQQQGTPVYRSPSDKRDYRYLKLDNELSVLLVSDPDTDKAAASLSVNIGSFENPQDRDGLAHFLEHMLFLGTDKFPEPGEYQSFISEHGGMFNAYTSLEETNYFFDVDARHLMPALDRFSRFFVAPLFNQDYVDREQLAVESEYRLKLKDDSRREWDVLSELANPEHPFSGFSVGSLETLSDRENDPVREDLLAFYQRYYSANLMELVVLGAESLDELEQAVRQRFAAVPNHDVTLKRQDIPLFAQPTPFKVSIVPEKDVRTLSFNFPLPTVTDYWTQKPLEYLGHLLGHEGEGSLLAALKKQGWAEGLSAGLVYDSRVGALFSASITLTEAGLANQGAIAAAFFDWLELVKRHGVESWRYHEVATMAQLDFRFAEKVAPLNYVSGLSTRMHQYPASEILRGDYLFGDFDPSLIARLASALTLKNAAIVLMAPGEQTDRVSKMYQVPYRVEALHEDSLSAQDRQWPLHLPVPNSYVPESLVIHSGQAGADPVRLDGVPAGSLWLYEDSQFNTPRAVFEAKVSVAQKQDVRRDTLLDVYLALVEDELSAETYPAAIAGLGFDLSRWEKGLMISVQGYSEKQAVLLDKLLATLAKPDWDQARFERVVDSLRRDWRNSEKAWPIRQLFDRLGPELKGGSLPVEKARYADKITLRDLQQFAAELMVDARARYFAGGNLPAGQARAMARKVTEQLNLPPADVSFDASFPVKELEPRAVLPAIDVAIDHQDSAVLLYLQGRDDSLRERALVALLQLASEAPFYSQLRTERQLGYVVGSSIAPMGRVPGMIYYVQSPVKDSSAVQQEIEAFFTRFAENMAETGEADLARYKQSLLTSIEEKPKNIQELSARYLESLDLGYETFDFRQQLADAIRAVSLDDFRAAYSEICAGKRKGLWLRSRPHTVESAE